MNLCFKITVREYKGRFTNLSKRSNTYLTSHFPLISIILYSTAFAVYSEGVTVRKLNDLGVYKGMMEFFSESGIKLTLLFLLLLIFFMIFAALKLIADTILQLSLLFFSKDREGHNLNLVRSGSWIYLITSTLSLLFVGNFLIIVSLFFVASFIYFVFFVYKVSETLSPFTLVGIIFFNILFWFAFVLSVAYALVKLYNSFIASLPL